MKVFVVTAPENDWDNIVGVYNAESSNDVVDCLCNEIYGQKFDDLTSEQQENFNNIYYIFDKEIIDI